MKRLWWIEHRYVVPVLAETFDEAKTIAYRCRYDIAKECGPVEEKENHPGMWRGSTDREGWDGCQPYGGEDGRTVSQILDVSPEPETILTPAEIREERSIRKGEAEMQEGSATLAAAKEKP